MRLVKLQQADSRTAVGILEDQGGEQSVKILDLTGVSGVESLADILNSADPRALVESLIPSATSVCLDEVKLLAPIDQQEVWAAGVTYKRSQVARMEESEAAASHYDKVYSADRPEIFFKATPHRVAGPNQPVRVRFDSHWSVPEPEFTLVLNPQNKIVGYTIGNDMSARDIEGENPLYLPQAKVYRQCCGLGPAVLLVDGELDLKRTEIHLEIRRGETVSFEGTTDLTQLHRKLPDLAKWLSLEDDFPNGAFLMTGTGLVPDNFSLEDGDTVSISISGIGTLVNPVVKKTAL